MMFFLYVKPALSSWDAGWTAFRHRCDQRSRIAVPIGRDEPRSERFAVPVPQLLRR